MGILLYSVILTLLILINLPYSNVIVLEMNKSFGISSEFKNDLANKIKNLYQKQLGHQIENVFCGFRGRTLTIILEGTITQPEKILNQNQNQKLARQVREIIDDVIQPQIKSSIEEVIDVKVIDYLSSTAIDRNRTFAIAIFEGKNGKSRTAKQNAVPQKKRRFALPDKI